MERAKTSVPAPKRSTRTSRPVQSKSKTMKTLSAGIIPVLISAEDTEPLYLLLRCYNYWDFPKGGVQGEETSLQAALRELEEETTLTEPEFPWGEDHKDTPIYADGKVARYFVARVNRKDVSLPINPLLGRAEHQEFRWVTYNQALKLINARVLAILDWAREVSASPAK